MRQIVKNAPRSVFSYYNNVNDFSVENWKKVKENDSLVFNICNYKSKGSDVLLGTAEIDISRELPKHNGEFKDVNFILEIINPSKVLVL